MSSSQAGRRPARGNGNRQGRSSRNGNGPRRGAGRPNQQDGRHQAPRNDDANAENGGSMKDEEILIAFMPYLKDNHAEAAHIHEVYQHGNDQRAFLTAARSFLERQRHGGTASNSQQTSSAAATSPPFNSTHPHVQSQPQQIQQHLSKPMLSVDHPSHQSPPPSDMHSMLFGKTLPPHHPPPKGNPKGFPQELHNPSANGNMIIGGSRGAVPQQTAPSLGGPPGLPSRMHNLPVGHMPREGQPRSSAPTNANMNMSSMANSLNDIVPQGDPIIQMPGTSIWGNANGGAGNVIGATPITPPRSSAAMSMLAPMEPQMPQGQPPGLSSRSPWGKNTPNTQPSSELGSLLFPAADPATHQQSTLVGATPATTILPKGPYNEPSRKTSIDSTSPPPVTTAPPPTTTNKVKREIPPPKRLWTRFEEQPGRIAVDNVTGEDYSRVLALGPRSELTAHWSLPLAYIRDYSQKKLGRQASSLEEAIRGLTVGLFRRGCTENGSQASIISKLVAGENNRSYDFWRDPASESVRGRVPFYSPRTPGYVIFRLYWDDEPLYTLAMGPSLLVQVLEPDFEGSVRFILSNFKGKKSNPTSLSSVHSLSIVLQTLLHRPTESSARATWGCIQEARKVIEACAAEYTKTSTKLATFEETVNELKKQVEEEEAMKSEEEDEESKKEVEESEALQNLREKTRVLNSGRASCERKWRDSQQAFASILKAVASNPTISMLLRRDLITKMRLEYELWCPLSEEFAVPSNSDAVDGSLWFEHVNNLPSNITTDHFRLYAQSRARMQRRTLGFDPNTSPMHDILFPVKGGVNTTQPDNKQRAMDSRAVSVFNNVSAAMGLYYQKLYINEDVVVRQREMIRERTQECVDQSRAFPPGTRVVIFGSSANGFGSPKSDLDMCLQLPEDAKLSGEAGHNAMAELANVFEKSGMEEVDTSRLGARIPIVMFHCPNPLSNGNESEFIECDLSMHNTLAVLNTHLLRAYAEISPVTRVLSSIIKRWAKARDINNPARHTLSSYGYIIMLLHFLTYHRRSGNGLVSPIAASEGSRSDPRNRNNRQHTPILPNLQWMDPMWPNFPSGTPYKENESLPKDVKKHPMEESKTVNAYFYKSQTPNDKAKLQSLFPGQDLSLAILLASFFRYYAYEFDYKRYVVSLHSTCNRGLVEREVKAELDGWRNYSAALTIEDPFETFYDVAHVLRGGYYHRIRREFTIAYSKIADAASGRQLQTGTLDNKDFNSMSGDELIDWICEPVSSDRDQPQQQS